MRYLQAGILKDLRKKMVFISGPRQCGKTTLARSVLAEMGGQYFNWDAASDRKAILGQRWSTNDRLVGLDEIHKYGKWKSWLKGVWDTHLEQNRFLVTGSARMDIYRRGGDSMLGRYHSWRLHPFCLAENPSKEGLQATLLKLLERGGFPE